MCLHHSLLGTTAFRHVFTVLSFKSMGQGKPVMQILLEQTCIFVSPKKYLCWQFFFVCIAPRRCELSFRTYHFLKVSINIMCQSVKLLSFIQKLFKRDSWIANKETISSADLRGVVIYSPSMFVCVFNCFKILTPLSCK